MTYDAATLAIATVALLLAGIGKGGFGGVGGFAATPILVLAVPPGDAVGVMLPLLMLMDAAALKAFWRRWAWPDLRMLMTGMALGTAAGWALFDALSPGALKIAIAHWWPSPFWPSAPRRSSAGARRAIPGRPLFALWGGARSRA
jgi:uncharacterized membrane protein YfcA